MSGGTSSTWAGCETQVKEILAKCAGLAASPEFGIFVFRPEGKAYWEAYELCDFLRRCDVPFVQAKFSNPLAGFLSGTGRKALQDLGVEFWNKD